MSNTGKEAPRDRLGPHDLALGKAQPDSVLLPALSACRAVCAAIRSISYESTVLISSIEDTLAGGGGEDGLFLPFTPHRYEVSPLLL